MTKRVLVLLIMLTIVLPAAKLTGSAAEAVAEHEAKTITLGLVAKTHQKEIEAHFQDFVRYLAHRISDSRSKVQGRIILVSTQSQLANRLREKRADFYMESPHPTYMINDVYAAGKLLLRRWKGGMADYHAAIFTRKDGDVSRLENLKGKLIAFEDAESTSGYFLPKVFLTKRGFKLSQKSQADAKVAENEIAYIFAQTQDRLMDLVLTKRVAAGAFSNDDHRNLDSVKKSAIVILAETASLPRHLVSVRRDLPGAISKSLEKALLEMHENREGRVLLDKADGTTKFDALPGGALAIRQRLLDTYYSPGREKR
jgi:phosphonate transport system substrate-binding protein